MPEAYDRNKNQFDDVAVSVMEAILTIMCPITYSPGNLKSLVTKGKRVQNKTTLMRIIERNTGISGEDTIEPSRRCDRMVAEDIIAAYRARGCRGKDLKLPPDYERDGPYEYKIVGNVCKVTNKFEGTEAMVTVLRLAELYIDLPWSESRAVLRQKNGDFRMSMAQIFANSNMNTQPSKEAEPTVADKPRPSNPRRVGRAQKIAHSPLATPEPTPRPYALSPVPDLEESQDLFESLDECFEEDGDIDFMECYLIRYFKM